jgi:hypothetical protein
VVDLHGLFLDVWVESHWWMLMLYRSHVMMNLRPAHPVIGHWIYVMRCLVRRHIAACARTSHSIFVTQHGLQSRESTILQ